MRPGIHVSISGGITKSIERAIALDCESMQIFTSSPRGWRQRIIEDDEAAGFRKARELSNIHPVIVHTPYLVNLSASNTELWNKSIASIASTLINSEKLGIEYVVTHVGGEPDVPLEKRLDNLSAALVKIFEAADLGARCPVLLLENGAGAQSSTLSTLEGFTKIFKMTEGLPVACCLDTCHLFAAGFDISSGEKLKEFIKQADDLFGLNRIKAWHLNDAKGGLGSNLDRHEHIGEGNIGIEAFSELMSDPRFSDIPGILETPKKTVGDDIKNLEKLRKLSR